METTELNVQKRERAGKGAARATRRAGLVPGVIYGDKKPPVLIALDPRDLERERGRRGFWTRMFDVKVEGKNHRTLCQEVQNHPITGHPEHVDFLRVSRASKLTLEVPVRFINEETSPGLKRGGVLNIVRRQVEVNCTPETIPSEFVVDLAGLEINDSVHISSIDVPEGVEPTITDRDFTVATIAAPSGLASEAEEEGEGEELEEGLEEGAEEETEEVTGE